MFYFLVRFICRCILLVFCPMRVRGAGNIPLTGGFLLAGNHQSFLDPVVFGLTCPRPLDYMARADLFGNPFFARLLKSCRAFPLKRHSADLGALREALKRLKAGGGIILFPEGTRGSGGQVGAGLSGVSFLARKSGAMIIPAYVQGTDKALPRGAKFIRPARIEVRFGRPITFPADRRISDEEMTAEVMQGISSLKYGIFF